MIGHSCNTNKDHQRMMVDPMFMIVKNLRLFLTAVTPTAVTPTAVILWNNFRWIWTILDHFGETKFYILNYFKLFWTILNRFGEYPTTLDHFENVWSFWTKLDHFKPFWTIFRQFWIFLDQFWSFRTMLNYLGPFWTI